MKSTCLLLVAALAYVRSEKIDFNSAIDGVLNEINKEHREIGGTYVPISPMRLSENVSWTEGNIFGLDSLVRTEDNTIDQEGSTTTYDFHYGLGLWVQTFKDLKVHGEDMSAYFRIRNNSIHLAFTVHNDSSCHVDIDDYRFEALGDVEFGSSLAKFDGADVEEFFKHYLLPFLNKTLGHEKQQLEKMLQKLCSETEDRTAVLQEVIQNSLFF